MQLAPLGQSKQIEFVVLKYSSFLQSIQKKKKTKKIRLDIINNKTQKKNTNFYLPIGFNPPKSKQDICPFNGWFHPIGQFKHVELGTDSCG